MRKEAHFAVQIMPSSLGGEDWGWLVLVNKEWRKEEAYCYSYHGHS